MRFYRAGVGKVYWGQASDETAARAVPSLLTRGRAVALLGYPSIGSEMSHASRARKHIGPREQEISRPPRQPSAAGHLSFSGSLVALICMIVPLEIAQANDTEAEIGIGGLVLRKNRVVEMRSEDLYVSAKEIRVRYRFFNNSSRDVTMIVAFPLPDVAPLPSEGSEQSGLTELEFSTRIDSVPVRTQREQKAIVNGVDRTDVLNQHGIPLDPNQSQGALDNLPPKSLEELIRVGLAAISQHYVQGRPMKPHLNPLWTLNTTYYWEQAFPAKKEIMIEHRYRPSVGGYSAEIGSKNWSNMRPRDSLFLEYQLKYCIDREFMQSAKRIERQYNQTWGEQWISYILTTGGNWAGAIGEFRLVVDKGDPLNLVSFCADGVRKISATQFEVRKRDFVPSKDLDVLILTLK